MSYEGENARSAPSAARRVQSVEQDLVDSEDEDLSTGCIYDCLNPDRNDSSERDDIELVVEPEEPFSSAC